MSDDQILGNINYLKSRQQDIFSTFHSWAKDYVKYNGNAKPIYIFLLESSVTRKSGHVKTMYNTVSKIFLFNCKEPKTLHSLTWTNNNISSEHWPDHHTFCNENMSRSKVAQFKAKAALRNKSSVVKFIMTDETSITSREQ